MQVLHPTPSSKGFRMPPEWDPHAATWLTWPHDEEHWPGMFERIEPYWARMVRELEDGEDVHVLIHDDETQSSAEKHMKEAGVVGSRLRMHRVPNNFSWMRDHGPTFVKNAQKETVLIQWKYNAWGGKWAHELDRHIPERIAEIAHLPLVKAPMVLEGGSIDVNGLGSLLTTMSCLLHPNRNPTLSKEQIEENLKEYLGVSTILWLGRGIAGDDTDGHIDDLSRFIGPQKILTVFEENPADENFDPLQENLRRLQSMSDQSGENFEIVTVPMPSPVFHDGERLPATYANFYIGSEVVLLPVFDQPNDRIAADALQKAFPTRRIAAIDSRDLVWGLGAFHCVTQQEPL